MYDSFHANSMPMQRAGFGRFGACDFEAVFSEISCRARGSSDPGTSPQKPACGDSEWNPTVDEVLAKSKEGEGGVLASGQEQAC